MGITVKQLTDEDLQVMLAEHKALNPDLEIRADIKESLIMYSNEGLRPGGFLESVLANDLFGALGKADSYNRATIFQITSYIYNFLPSNCWGSYEIVNEWVDKITKERSE